MIADKLKELRVSNGKGSSQQYVADILKIKQQTYATYENGTREPNIQTIIKLANYFNVSTDYLLGNTPYKNSSYAFDNILPKIQDRILEIKDALIRCASNYADIEDEDTATTLLSIVMDTIHSLIVLFDSLIDYQQIEGVPPELDRAPELLLIRFTETISDIAKQCITAVIPYLSSEEITTDILAIDPSKLEPTNLLEKEHYNISNQKVGLETRFYKIFIKVTEDMGLDIPAIVQKTGLSDREARGIIMKQMKNAPLPIALKLTEALGVPLQVWTGELPYIAINKK